MSIQDFSTKKITVLGAGISGRSAALALARHGAEVTLSDMKEYDLQEEPWASLVKEDHLFFRASGRKSFR